MFTLKVSTANAAFDEPAPEIARILRNAANDVMRGKTEGRIADINGNTVGSWRMQTQPKLRQWAFQKEDSR